MQSHTGTVDGALLPSAANTLNGQARRTAKKAPSTVTNFFKTATSILYFRTARLSFRRFFSYTCFFLFNMRLFFTDAIISYSIQKSIVWIVNIYTLFPVFLYIFYIFPDYFRLYFNDLIFFTDFETHDPITAPQFITFEQLKQGSFLYAIRKMLPNSNSRCQRAFRIFLI